MKQAGKCTARSWLRSCSRTTSRFAPEISSARERSGSVSRFNGREAYAVALSLVTFSALISAQNSQTDATRFFDDRVEPILSKRCLGCHNEELKDGGISFLDRDTLLKGGRRGPAIVPGKPEESGL